MATRRTVAITTTASDPVVSPTTIASVVNSTERAGAAARDHGDDFLLADRKCAQDWRCMHTKRIGDRRQSEPYFRRNVFSIAFRALASALSVICR